ncbi:MAG: DegT/DnrJ/EryC1/StrS aminotransferase family protein [candidate division KSB1 bacterium]|nr:DegT/DnrJ/EryC1/StrS aminotransferase family protein [candidate division KSB1 bacterium]
MSSSWRFPLSDLRLGPRELDSVRAALESGWLSQGPVTARFEAAFAQYVGARYAVAVSNGTAALHLAYRALGVAPGDQVICPSLTFVATVNAVLYCGAEPVFAEILDLDHPVLDAEDVARKLTPRTRCIAVVDYGGYPWEIEAVREVARAAGIPLVEDAAHAVGASRNGRKFGTFGDVGCFSFFSNKNMTTGEGGMVVTDNEGIAARVRLLRSHGMTAGTWERHRSGQAEYDVVDIGYNYRLDEMRAALGLAQLALLDEYNRKRQALVARYWENLGTCEAVRLPFFGRLEGSACHLLPVLIPSSQNRRQFVAYLQQHGVQTSHHYPPVHKLKAYRDRYPTSLPVTEEFAAREVTLPLHPHMKLEDVDQVCDIVRQALQ